jgi:formate dehydrogenase subunit gamma
MTARSPASEDPAARLLRFDAVQRAVHWATAVLFAVVMVTALALYFPSVAVAVGRRHLIAQIHLWTGVALPGPLLAGLAGPWGARLRRDLRLVNRWSPGDVRWLRSLGRVGTEALGKFNPGQKLNAIFVGSSMLVSLASGFVLQWFGFFPLGWRTGATLVHDIVAVAVYAVVLGHVAFALSHRDALRSMMTGWVTEAWARRHAPLWVRELRRDVDRDPDRPVGPAGRADRLTRGISRDR